MIPLLVDLEHEWRGGQNQFLLLLRGLYGRGHAAELLAGKGSSLGHRAEKAGICVHYTPRRSLLTASRKVRSLIEDGRFELVHANEGHALSAAWLARTHRRVPLLISRRVGFPLGKGGFSAGRVSADPRGMPKFERGGEEAAVAGAAQEKIHGNLYEDQN